VSAYSRSATNSKWPCGLNHAVDPRTQRSAIATTSTENTHRIKDTTITTVSKPIVAIKTLWVQRAIFPSMFNLPVTITKRCKWEQCSFAE
jgi:hypothetical protein